MSDNNIHVWGAREHNLKNIDVTIPRDSLTVITGLSGSGKSSLAFDTIYSEGQRRYIETFSAYARNFLDNLERPDVDKISGLSPVISIDQKTTNRNPRSTVGTVTEIYDYLRLLYARIGIAYSYVSGEPMVKYTEEKILSLILERYEGHRIYLLAPVVRNRKGHYRELFESIRKKGFLHARIDGEVKEIISGLKLNRYQNHSIDIVIDKMVVKAGDKDRLTKSVATAFRHGDNMLAVMDDQTQETRFYSKQLMCPVSGISYHDPSPHDFSFNSPMGACPKCRGLGQINFIDIEKVIPRPELSIRKGGIAPLGKYSASLIFWKLEALLSEYECDLDTPLAAVPEEALDEIINGTERDLRIPASVMHTTNDYYVSYEGLGRYIEQMCDREMSAAARKWADQFNSTTVCPECHGARLNREALHFFIDGKNIHEVASMDLDSLNTWLLVLYGKLNKTQMTIAYDIQAEIIKRVNFLRDVGLGYLTLSRPSVTLSGGESQRIRLATQIGSQLVGVLYILDEPSIGLHQRDNQRLINSLKKLRDMGNTVIVVEHDEEMMRQADYIVDLGPRAGRLGGEVVYQGTYEKMLSTHTLTAQYLNGELSLPRHKPRRKGNGHYLSLFGARGNNLKGINVHFPLGTLTVVSGVSGSGKSSLVTDTLLPILSAHFYRSQQEPLPYDSISGLEHINKVINVDQSPIGRIPRSNPATYTGVFNDIRNLFASLPEASMRGYGPGRFSFNVAGGRCPTCKGNGYKNIEMNFLPNVMVPCETCHGKRYNRETLEVKYKGKSISDVLDMTVNQAVEFFDKVPSILRKISALKQVGLGYIKLGQSSTTLSGGESQRVKLATELSRKDTGKTLYILDEPTTGLHFEDIRVLMSVLEELVDRGNTVIIIEHNLDVIRQADYIIDMGRDGGKFGGYIIDQGTPEEVAQKGCGHTAKYI